MRSLLRIVGEVKIKPVPVRKIQRTWRGKRYHPKGRDSDINSDWLVEDQYDHVGGTFVAARFAEHRRQGAKMINVARAMFRASGRGMGKGVQALCRELKFDTLWPLQVQDLIERTDRGEDTHLRTDGWREEGKNYFWMWASNAVNGGIAVLIVYRDRRKLWHLKLSTCGITSKKLRKGTVFYWKFHKN